MTCFMYHTWGYMPGSFLSVEDTKMKNAVFITEAHCPPGSQTVTQVQWRVLEKEPIPDFKKQRIV